MFGIEWWMVVIGIALFFDFMNGVNDAANSIATIVATKVLTPVQAVGLAAVMNFLGPFLLGTAVAATVGTGLIDPNLVTTNVIAAALAGGIFATALATIFGLPISVSHSLIGGLLGAGFAVAGFPGILLPTQAEMLRVLSWGALGALAGCIIGVVLAEISGSETLAPSAIGGTIAGTTLTILVTIGAGVLGAGSLTLTVLFIFFSPLLGFVFAFILGTIVIRFTRNADAYKANWWFRKLQLVSVSAFSLSHGTNDAQKTMGVIALVLLAAGQIPEFRVDTWVIVTAAAVIALGTFIGGWRVVETVGHKLTDLSPDQGFTAETAGAGLLFFMAWLGIPVSTTHTITGSIMGVGATRRLKAVRWTIARHILGAWILTIPIASLAAWLTFKGMMLVL